MTALAATTFEELPIGAIAPHPQQVRHDLGTPEQMDEMAASIAELGIVEPLIVAPPFSAKGRKTSWRYTLIAGQRRLVGAVAAELTTVPCMVRHDLDTPAKQLLVMQIENDHRKGLRVTEQADGYQALFELDMAPALIAKKLGRTRAFVEGRLSISGLPARARDGVDHGQLTIADALELAAFTDPDVVEDLARFVGTASWVWRLHEAKGDRDRAQAAKNTPPKGPAKLVEDVPAPATDVPTAVGTDPADPAPEVIPDGRTARAALLRTLDTAARVRHAHLAKVITAGETDVALVIARARVTQAAKDALYDQSVVDRVLCPVGPDYVATIKAMTLPQAVIALDVLLGLARDADLARSASAWRQTSTAGWRQHLAAVLGYTWSAAEVELLGDDPS